ncbi:TspO/MBR family protein [Clostridium thermarum]|uniref:TspO/MBR family protein n=1 Tax=Clostridium thermarum TaxID=1716543 RepID=UPI00111C9BB6|nr:TspO/MBR family protein [Clostridium thermarum]
MNKKKLFNVTDWGALIISIIIAEGLGYISSAFNRGQGLYYKVLHKPTFAPPSWLFGIVWPLLYLLMAIAAYIIWIKRKEGKHVGKALVLYILQLIVNFIWPFIFFKLNLFGIAFIVLVILLLLVILTTISFLKHSKLASILMVPYIIWLVYAAVLNYYIWLLNEA